MDDLKQNIKQSFSKVKEDITQLKNQLKELKDELNSQKMSLNEVLPKINRVFDLLKDIKKEVSIGNEGVRQTDRHLDRQTDTRQVDTYKPLNTGLNNNNSDFTEDNTLDRQTDTRQTFRQTDRHLDTHQEYQQTQNNIKIIADDINKIFLKLTKQELRVFLTIYQLEDEGIEPTYKSISIKTQLSESCIRDHISSLFKKNTPIIKKRLNNHTNTLSVLKDFKVLNLKNKLINLYYDSDPHQKTLLDI